MKRFLTIVVWVIFLMMVGRLLFQAFQPMRDGDQRDLLTRFDLKDIERALARYIELGAPLGFDVLRNAKSVEDLWFVFHEVEDKGYPLVSGRSHERSGKDAWGSPYLIEVNIDNVQTVVRVLSTGPDRVHNDGGGDDLYIEVYFSEQKGVIKIIRNWDFW